MSRQWIAKSIGCFSGLLLAFGCSAAYADWQVEVYGGVAGLSTDLGPEVIAATPPQVNTLGGSTDSAEFAPGVGISYDFPLQSPQDLVDGFYIFHDVSLGVNAYYLGGTRSGPVYLFSNESDVDNNYNMSLSSWRVMLDSEFNFHPFWHLMPFIEVGAGDAINTMKYSETPVTVGGFEPLNAHTETTNNFAYELGGGLKMPISPHTTISLRYLYTNLGDAEVSDSATSVYTLQQPITAGMHSSSLLFGLNYGFGSGDAS